LNQLGRCSPLGAPIIKIVIINNIKLCN